MGAEDNGERWEGDLREIGGQVDRAEPGRGLTESDSRTRGDGNDASRIVGVGNNGATEPDLATTAYGFPGDPNGLHVLCRIKNVEGVGHRGWDCLAISPPTGLGSGNRQWGCHDSATRVAHIGAQGHAVWIDLL